MSIKEQRSFLSSSTLSRYIIAREGNIDKAFDMIVASLNWRHEWHPEVFFYRLLIFSLYDAPNETNLVITFEIMLNWKLFLGLFLILLKYIRKYLRMKFERTFQCVKCTSKFVEIINSNIFHAQLIQANRFVCVGLF